MIAATERESRQVPCVFSSGDHQGYFGSLTSLKNDLPAGRRGECEVDNQLDQRVIPALVMPGGSNPVSAFGAKVGDLVLANRRISEGRPVLRLFGMRRLRRDSLPGHSRAVRLRVARR